MHIEIPGGADTSPTRAFWSALFGWQFEEIPVPSAEYFLTREDGRPGGPAGSRSAATRTATSSRYGRATPQHNPRASTPR